MKSRQPSGSAAVDRAQARPGSARARGGSGPGRGSCRRRRSTPCASGPQQPARAQALEVVRDRLAAHRRVRVGEAAELVRVRLARLVLERVRVHGVEGQPARGREGLQLAAASSGGPTGCAGRPSGVTRTSCWTTRAVLQLLEDVARLAGPGEAREARAAGAHAPGRHRHRKACARAARALDVDAAPARAAARGARSPPAGRRGPGAFVRRRCGRGRARSASGSSASSGERGRRCPRPRSGCCR